MRIIGIRHRVKKTKEGESRPTQICILQQDGSFSRLDLATETDELDFVLGRYPTKHRKVEAEDDLTGISEHQIRFRKMKTKEGETPDQFPESHLRADGKKWLVATHIPIEYEGLRADDRVAMLLGGSGDNLSYASARYGQEIGVRVFRIPPFVFKQQVERQVEFTNRDKDQDAQFVANLLRFNQTLFYEVGPRDMSLISLRENRRALTDAMKARIACEQRLRQRVIGINFCTPEGKFPEGSIEKQFDAAKANDRIYKALCEEEAEREQDLTKACEPLEVYQKIFLPLEGCGVRIASRIIGAVMFIHRFIKPPDESKLRELYAESQELEQSINFSSLLQQATGQCHPDANRFQKTQMLRDLLVKKGQHADATVVGRLLDLHRARHHVRRDALNRSRSAFRAYCGVHLRNGVFPRRRNDEVANWSGDCRQAMYLLADQFNRRPESVWGVRLLQAKAKYRRDHPEPIVADDKIKALFRQLEVFFRIRGVTLQPEGFKVTSIDGLYSWFRACVTELDQEADLYSREIEEWEVKIERAQISGKTVKMFTAGHTHKMAIWYTLGKFAEWLFREWYRLEKTATAQTNESPGEQAAA